MIVTTDKVYKNKKKTFSEEDELGGIDHIAHQKHVELITSSYISSF